MKFINLISVLKTYFYRVKYTAAHIAQALDGKVVGDPSIIVTHPAKIQEAVKGSITFLSNEKYEPLVYNTEASIVLVDHQFSPIQALDPTLIRVSDVYNALSKLLSLFKPRIDPEWKIAETAIIEKDVVISEEVSIGHHCVIKSGSKIGKNCIINDQVFIGRNVSIGQGTVLYPGVRIYDGCIIGNHCIVHANAVIGSDGFGFARDESGQFAKIPQIGNVVIKNYVEVGAGTTIDRATIGSTTIAEGVKLDNLIQVGHNVSIGKNTAIAAQAGISGSTEIGNNCMIGGQAGFVGHIKVANDTMIQAKSGVAGNITENGQKLYGYPAIDYQNYLKSYAYFKRLPEIVHRIRELEQEFFHNKNKH